jgi:quercetin 2,3-dioxygenase
MKKTRREVLGISVAALGSVALGCATRPQRSPTPGSEQIKETMQPETTTTPRTARPVDRVLANSAEHWVGDGFRVRSVINPQGDPRIQSPFLLLDHAPSRYFEPGTGTHRRGVGEHPHRGFETVTFAYRGEIAHRDSSGGGGLIGSGDVQWMTAAGGIVHEEFHSQAFTQQGGDMEMVQLWVNLPAKHKMDAPGYQALLDKDFPRLQLEAAKARLIAGTLNNQTGPARTHTPMTLFDLKFEEAGPTNFELPRGFTTLCFTLEGDVYVGPEQRQIQPGSMAVLARDSEGLLQLQAAKDARVLVLSGQPINEPVAAYGPFVMNTRAELVQAMEDYQSGKMGHLS